MRRKNGFTLVELLAVIVVLAIIMIIAIPAVLEAMSRSRRDSFYLYAQKLYSESIAQYTRDLEENPDNLSCAIYDIKNDLGLSDTGNFDGWAKVTRKPASSGKYNVAVKLNESKELQTIRFCVGKGEKCTPNQSYYVSDGTKSTTISKAIKEDQVLCVSYQIPGPDGKTLVNGKTQCVNYKSGTPHIDTYEYEVNLTLTNRSYSVENVVMSEEISKDAFFDKVDEFNSKHSTLEITKPSCNGDTDPNAPQKGTTSTGITAVSGSSSSTRGTQIVSGPEISTRDTMNVSGSTSTTHGTIDVSGPSGSGPQGTSNVASTMISNDRSTLYVDKTTMPVGDITDATMLQSLTIQGYDIKFNPGIYYYELTVPNNVTSLNVTATPKIQTSQTKISGQNNFGVGENLILVEVLDTVTNKRAYYRTIVTRLNEKGEKPTTASSKKPSQTEWDPNSGLPDPTLEESNALLKSLKVSGYQLDFNPEVYEYTLTTKGESEIFVIATAENRLARVLVTGNKDIKDGSEVKVKVTSRNNFYDKTYTIKLIVPKVEDGSKKMYRMVAIGLVALLAIVLTVVALTKKNRRANYNGDTYATSGPGVNGQGGKTFEEQQQGLAQAGMLQNPTPNPQANPLPTVPVQTPNNVLPQTPVGQDGQNQGGNQFPPQ